MDILGVLLISGILQGGLYALIALGFVLIYKSSSIFNFAQGELVMLGGFLGWTFLSATNFGLWLALLCSFIIAALLGALIQRLFIAPLTGQPILSAILMTLGLASIIRGVTIMFWGPAWRSYPPIFPDSSINIAGSNVSLQYVFIFIIVIISFCLFLIFFNKTKIGLAMRSTAEDHQTARSIGINVSWMFSLNWIIVCMLATLGGFLLATSIGVVTALSEMGLKSISVVLLGGLESIPGVVIGGIIVGILENLGGGYIDPLVGGGTKEIIPYVILLIVLLIKPYGLFGLKRIERV